MKIGKINIENIKINNVSNIKKYPKVSLPKSSDSLTISPEARLYYNISKSYGLGSNPLVVRCLQEVQPLIAAGENLSNIYSPLMLGNGYESYINNKFSADVFQAISSKGVIIRNELKAAQTKREALVESNFFLPSVYSRGNIYEIYNVYGSDIMSHLGIMMYLMGITADKIRIQQSTFSLETLFYDTLGLERDLRLSSLTIAPLGILNPMWRTLSENDDNSWRYINNQFSSLKSQLEDEIRQLMKHPIKNAERIQKNRKKIELWDNLNERKNLDDIMKYLHENRLLNVQNKEDKSPEEVFRDNVFSFLRKEHQLNFGNRNYGYKWSSNGGNNLFLNIDMFYGDLTGLASEFFIKGHGVKLVNFFGATGGLAEELEPGMTFIPSKFNMNGSIIEGANSIDPQILTMPGLATGIQLNVPSPLYETMSILGEFEKVGQAVDCETGYLALLKKKYPEVNFNIGLKISDNPLYHEFPGSLNYDSKPILGAFGICTF